MKHGDTVSFGAQEQSKIAWRTPVLTIEKVTEVTEGDVTPVSSDSQTTSHGAPLGFTS